MRGKERPVVPLDLFFMLVDSCMNRLHTNAWKVVCYVAAQHLRVNAEGLEKVRDPSGFALRADLEKLGINDAPGSSGERPYRLDDEAPPVPGQLKGRFAIISLKELCRGLRIGRRRRDYGTGLSKSSVTKAINEAVQSGILVRKRHKSAAGRDEPSYYAINWDQVQDLDWQRRRGLRQVSK